MATKAKYYRVRPSEDEKEDKLDTDILMRFSNTYGKIPMTQANISAVLSPFSLLKTNSL